MRVGDQVSYRGAMYYIISIWEDGACSGLDTIEIAPTGGTGVSKPVCHRTRQAAEEPTTPC